MEIFKPLGFDKTLALTTLVLLGLGFVMVFSSSAVLAQEKYSQSLYFFIRQLIAAGTGLAAILFILQIRKPFFQSPFLIYGLLLLTLFLLATCFVMPPVARTNRWIQVFGLRFQPSELAKISLVLFLAYYLDRKRERLDDWRTLIFPLSIVSLFTLLILKEPDYGTALLIFGICAALLYLGGIKVRHLAVLGLGAAGLFAFFLFKAS